MKELIKNAAILFAITLLAGSLLGFMFEVTKEARGSQMDKQVQEAYKNVFPQADRFESLNFDAGELEDVLNEKGLTPSMEYVSKVVEAFGSEDELAGYIITVVSKEGYAGDIEFAVGINLDGIITGISFLSIKETAGLGMAVKETEFIEQFQNKKVESFVYTKNEPSEDNEIDAVSGATISTNAVTNGVNAAIYCFSYITGLGGDSIG